MEQHGFNVHAFADDLQVYGHAAQHETAVLARRMSACIENVKAWMSSNRLRLNPSKTELIWLGSSRRLHHCSGTGMRVSGVDLQPVDCVRDLGVLIDSGMTLARHVNYISGVCFFQLRPLRIIRRSLTADAAHALVRALIHTRIDYCNGLLVSCPRYLTDRLQVVLRQAGTATTIPVIRVGNHASAVTLVGCGGPGELQDRPPRLQMPPWSSSRLPIRSVRFGFNFRRSRQHAFIHKGGPTAVRPTNQNQDTGHTRVLLRLVCRVELAPGGLA